MVHSVNYVSQELPLWYRNAMGQVAQDAFGRYNQQNREGYRPFTLPQAAPGERQARHRLAPINPLMEQGFRLQGINPNATKENMEAQELEFRHRELDRRRREHGMRGLYENLSRPLARAEIAGMQDAYLNDVRNALVQQSNRNYEEFIRPALEAQFVRQGAHGGSRHARLTERALAAQNRDINDKLAELNYRNYIENMDRAMKMRHLSKEGGEGLERLHQQQRADEEARLQRIMQAGEMQRAHDQQARDIEYAQFLEERNFPQAILSTYINQINGINPGSAYGTNVQYTPPPPLPNTAARMGNLSGQLLGMRQAGMF